MPTQLIYNYDKEPWGDKPYKLFSTDKNLSNFFRNMQNKFNPFNKNKEYTFLSIWGLLGIVLFIWLISGFYIVQSDEEGVELIFGKYTTTTLPGLHYRIPSPIGKVTKVKMTAVNREEVGFKENNKGKNYGEGIMLTGDENIVSVNFEVQWRINNARAYLYNIRNDNGMTVKNAAESAARETIGQKSIFFILKGDGRAKISAETRELSQKIVNDYNMGVDILSIQMKKVDPPEKVINAFRDVQSARADREREINQAESYRNDIVPRARGQAEEVLLEAQAYALEIVNKAKGESERFKAVYREYKLNKHIMKERIYLETMEDILAPMDKVITTNRVLPWFDILKKP